MLVEALEGDLVRMERRLGFSAAVIASVVLALPSLVEAQAWLDDRARTEGPGFRLGDLELHPGLGVEVGWDSNLYYSDDDAALPPVDTGILRATAHLMVSTRGQQRREEGEAGGAEGAAAPQPTIAFRGGLSGSFYYFFADEDRTNMELDAFPSPPASPSARRCWPRVDTIRWAVARRMPVSTGRNVPSSSE